jgi:hypothetical protein
MMHPAYRRELNAKRDRLIVGIAKRHRRAAVGLQRRLRYRPFDGGSYTLGGGAGSGTVG